jgi:HK97 family phage major capsid protein
MTNVLALKQRAAELNREVQAKTKAVEDGTITVAEYSTYMKSASSQDKEIAEGIRAFQNARALGNLGNLPGDTGRLPGQPWMPDSGHRMHTKKWSPPNPLDASQDQWKSLFLAARARTPFSATIGSDLKTKAYDTEMGLTTKDVGEGAPGSLLPPVLLPNVFGLPYEPDRLFSAFPGLPADSQSVSYLQHTGNTNPASPVDELQTKPTLGMQIESQTTSFTVIAALEKFSRQLLDDFSDFYSFVPQEMYRAVIDAETNQIVNGNGTDPNMTGILATSGLITRALGTDTVINALVKACNDLRIGTAFANADLIALHPSTWTKIKTQVDTAGRYLLNINAEQVGAIDNVFGVPVLTNTKIPIGTAIVFDTRIAIKAWTRMSLEMMVNPYGDAEFGSNAIAFRCEERIAIGLTRPTAINVVTGLGS